MATVVQDQALEQLGINVIRGLAMDAPARAKSGHSGTAMALAPLAHVLFTRVMRHAPSDPGWPDRDRFLLSCGHASILLYSMLYLTGYGLTLEDLKAFRSIGSLTPGHPERRRTPGVEVTTGPLGQGVGDGVGMGVAERVLRDRFGADVCDHHTFVICSDGCLEEGISHEAASLAGHLGLGRLVYVYDDNHITIDGPTELAYNDDVPERFAAYGWDVQAIGEVANDTAALEAALRAAMANGDQPSMIVLRSHIGWPAPGIMDTAKAHGNPLDADEIRKTKEILGLPPDESFWVPDAVLDLYRSCIPRGEELRREWQARFDVSSVDRDAWDASWSGHGLEGWEAKLPSFEAGQELATRRAINACLNATAPVIPGLLAGAADLTENTGVTLEGAEAQSKDRPGGRQLHYGIREHAMGAAMTGMAAHGGVLPVGGTFFTFSDYMRPAVRLAAMSRAHTIYFWTHDSIGVGEDGPTHEPIEHLASLRAMPGLAVVRPADANECVQAWRCAVEAEGPVALVLSRQGIPVLAESGGTAAEGLRRGGYVLRREQGALDLVLVGTGSEVHLCLGAAEALAAEGRAVRVVSLPCWEWFEDQDDGYRVSVLPGGTPTLSVEAGASFGWERYADASVAIDTYGASGPSAAVMEHFGFTVDHVAEAARALLEKGDHVSKLQALYADHGQSPWLDNLRRDWLRDGRLSEFVRSGVRGVTSNPTILAKAIEGQDDYDEQFSSLIGTMSVEDAYWELVIDDITQALGLLRGVYDDSGGTDGFVSLEVAPAVAHDTKATVAMARSLHERITTPNLFVKVPATPEGVPAIRELVAEGRSINVTLIFGLPRYDEVAEAYLAGLEAYAASGHDDLSSIAGVASFFVSRVDTEIDRRLEQLAGGEDGDRAILALRGKAAVAQAKEAYQHFERHFAGARWDALAAKGAQVQRPLWASTSTKNPAYPDLLYVDSLIGPKTVNTMPETTLEAFADHGTLARRVDDDPATAQELLVRLGEVGVDLADVSATLEDEGVHSFAKSFDELIQALSDKALALGRRR